MYDRNFFYPAQNVTDVSFFCSVPVDECEPTGATFTIGTNLEPEQEKALVSFLCTNRKVFAWEPNQLAGVPRDVIQHHLNVCPNVRPVKQKARWQSTEK